ncbi:MAG TPA: alkaline phosphatase family protein [Actinomycetota bacterium]|nr:alkaline phosphatase family protein [Actinomycetota bacterium]
MTDGPRVAVIGLDCATPALLFDRYAGVMPNIRSLLDGSLHGELNSITPPITVPAWACAMTGKTPGRLGIYGFRNRKDTTYEGLSIATSGAVKEPAVWDLLGEAGKRSLLIGVPPAYPIRPIDGWRVSCFLTPPSAEKYTWPEDLKAEVQEEVGDYIFDIPNFRQQGPDFVLQQAHEMTKRRFRVARRFVKDKPWDFFMMVEMGLDRLHHVFWHYCDPAHPKYEPGNRFESAFEDYYRMLDGEVGSLLEALPDDAVTILMSDHGARAMSGGVCFNDWLIAEGYLSLTERLDGPTPIAKAPIDWSKTTAWGDGGYYGRLFLNVRGREPEGTIDPEDYEKVRDEIAGKLEAMSGRDGEALGNRVIKPQDAYPEVRGVAPDLLVYFADLEWRSVGTVNMEGGAFFTTENDTGPDGANHDKVGVFALRGLDGQPTGRTEGLNLIDVGPTLMKLYGLPEPEGVEGRSLL